MGGVGERRRLWCRRRTWTGLPPLAACLSCCRLYPASSSRSTGWTDCCSSAAATSIRCFTPHSRIRGPHACTRAGTPPNSPCSGRDRRRPAGPRHLPRPAATECLPGRHIMPASAGNRRPRRARPRAHGIRDAGGTGRAGQPDRGNPWPRNPQVPCHHHQAIERVGGGLTATAWSDDGVIEAVELAGSTRSRSLCSGTPR